MISSSRFLIHSYARLESCKVTATSAQNPQSSGALAGTGTPKVGGFDYRVGSPYLRDMLSRLPRMSNRDDLALLLP